IQAEDNLSGVKDMMISWSESFPDAQWQSYNTQSTYTFISPGIKKLHIKFIDNAGNESQIYTTDLFTIIMPQTPVSYTQDKDDSIPDVEITNEELAKLYT